MLCQFTLVTANLPTLYHFHDIFLFLPLVQIFTSEDLNDIIMLSFSWQRAFPGFLTSIMIP